MQKQIALVTGANRGIGFEAVRQLAEKGVHVILTSRNEEQGEEACRELLKSKLDIEYLSLDVTDDASCDRIYNAVSQRHGRLDILVNNAGIFLDPKMDQTDMEEASIVNVPLDKIRKSLETNTFGAIRLCQRFVPLMLRNNYGRIVNVSSGMGQLSEMDGGYAAYRLSKVALNAVTRIFASELSGKNVLINSVCPGWVRTRMGGAEAERSPAEGATTIVWLALLPDNGLSGGFFRDKRPLSW